MTQIETFNALILDKMDNVATLLSEVHAGDRVSIKGSDCEIIAHETICFGHKIALFNLSPNNAIIKFGQNIGIATSEINIGDWVHIHNISSALDTNFHKRISL
jgi:altronate dehydratase small subunit